MRRPRRLRPGARIALVAPAGPLAPGAIDRARSRVTDMGWTPVVGANAHLRHGYLAGADEDRLNDLQRAISATDNDAIWCLRGGYGTMRLLRQLDFAALRDRPRPLIGFSDNTALHLALYRQGVSGFHGPHPAALELSTFSLEGVRHILGSTEPAGLLPIPAGYPPPRTLVEGRASGPLVGGNLSLLAATLGTPFSMDSEGAILFIEEVGEPVYRIDRLLSQLLLAGCFDSVAGVVIGAISDCPDISNPELPGPEEVVLDRLGSLGVPIASGFPFGHIEHNWTLPLGTGARLDATAGTLELLEPAVTT